MKNPEFFPVETMERVLARWWIVVMLTVLGGVTGWLFHYFQPPVYEATADITIDLFFQKRELTQYESDTAFNAAGAIISSSKVLDSLFIQAEGLGLSVQEINQLEGNIDVESKTSVWELHVRDQNPEIAAEYANLWASIAVKAMNDALKHAQVADQLQAQIDRLESCLPSPTPQPTQVSPPEGCKSYSLTEINSLVQTWASEMTDEQNLSQGVLSISAISLSREATVPEEPKIHGRASMVLGGACIGFLISIWLINFPKFWRHDRHH